MTSTATGTAPAADQLRGSSLLLVGRVLSMLLTFVGQVLIVRYLSQEDFGAFAYALSVVALVQSVLALGLDRADTRLLCLAEEARDASRFLGVLVLEACAVLSLGTLAVLAVLVWTGSGHASSLLLLLIVLAPLQAMDTLVLNTFAVLARPRAVFFRRYLLDPGLRLLVVVLVVGLGGSVRTLAQGYVIGALLGMLAYALLLVGLLRRSPLLAGRIGRPTFDARRWLGFSAPLLTSNVAFVATTTLGGVLLGLVGDLQGVAEFRAVQPVAALNLMVMLSFATLFTPMAARLYARGDHAGLREASALTRTWLAVLTLPVLLVTTALAEPLTEALFGARYRPAAPVLAVLAVGCYVNAALGFNGTLLTVLGHVRFLAISNLLTVAAALGLGILLVRTQGAMGAAVSTTVVLTLRNLVNQAGLWRRAEAGRLDAGSLRVFVTVGATTVCLTGVVQVLSLPLGPGLVLAGLCSLAVVASLRDELQVGASLPELARLPLLGKALVR